MHLKENAKCPAPRPPGERPVRCVLAIETSCDETGVALLDEDRGLIAHELWSQVDLHRLYGGVVPELASRDHLRRLLPLLQSTLARGGVSARAIDAVAYTAGPGLVGALLTGAALARALGYGWGVPALGVHHLEGHLLAPLLEDPAPPMPQVALLVSGGHTMLIDVRGIGDYRILGQTRDDAAGEAFDKTAKLLGLPYPGGPELARLAARGRPGIYQFPRPMLDQPGLEFSFSGLKTAVMQAVRDQPPDAQARADIAHAVQESIVTVLSTRALQALRLTGYTTLVVAGGVGANLALRERLSRSVSGMDAQVFYPRIEFCTDNAAMIAVAGLARLRAGERAAPGLDVRARWPLSELKPPGSGMVGGGREFP